MHKLGHVPTYLLLVVSIALAIGALFAFASFSNKQSVSAQDLAEMMAEVNFDNQYILNSAALIGSEAIKQGGGVSSNFQSLSAKRGIGLISTGNFFGKIRNKEFSFIVDGMGYRLNLQGVIVHAERGENEVKRTFDILIKFDNTGKVIP